MHQNLIASRIITVAGAHIHLVPPVIDWMPATSLTRRIFTGIKMITLLNCDCMEYMAGLPDKAFDLAIVDPEYGLGEDGGKNRSKGVKQKNGSVLWCNDGGYANKGWDKEPPAQEYFHELLRVSRHQIIWGINYMPVNLQGGAIVWDKMNDGSDQSGAEIAYCSLNNRVDVVRYMWRGMMQGDCIGSAKQQGNKELNEKRIHPTQKPVKLYEWLLTNYAKSGQRILDTHLGSGSSAIAAHNLGFEFVGMELDKDYFDAACARLKAHQSQQTLFAPEIVQPKQVSMLDEV